jgi:hypothetical protein
MILIKAYEVGVKKIPDKVERVNRDEIYERLAVLLRQGKISGTQMRQHLAQLLEKVGKISKS